MGFKPEWVTPITVATGIGAAGLLVGIKTDRIHISGSNQGSPPPIPFSDSRPLINCDMRTSAGKSLSFAGGDYLAQHNASLDAAKSVTKGRAGYMRYRPNDQDESAVCVAGPKNILIYGVNFNLDNSSDALLIASTIDGIFNRRSDKSVRKLENLDDILWLKKNAVIEAKNVPPILPVYQLEQVSRIMQGMKEAGFAKPQKLVFGDNGSRGTDNNALYFNYSNYVHRYDNIDSQFADFVLKRNPNLVQEYQTIDPLMSPQDVHGYLNSYLSHGETLRAEMLYEMAEGKKMKGESQKYRMAMGVFGSQYAGHSFVFEPKDYKPGDFARINDVERPDRPGILLRRDDLEKSPELRHVLHGDIVVVMGVPISKTAGETVEIYYPVQRGSITKRDDGTNLFTPLPSSDRYIRDMYLSGYNSSPTP